MKEIIESLFGVYEPLTEVVVRTYESVDGATSSTTIEQTVQGIAGVDFAYVAGVLLFAIVLYGFLRILGGFLKL